MMTTKKFILYFFIFLIITIPLDWFVFLFPLKQTLSFFANAPQQINFLIKESYPEDLIIDINKGQVSINRPSPYCLVLDQKSKLGIIFDINGQATNLTNPQGSIYSKLCNPLAMVGKNFIVYPDENQKGSYKIQPISDQVNIQITQKTINDLVSKYLPIFEKIGKIFYYSAPFMAVFFILPFTLLINCWYAFTSYLAIKLTKLKPAISYKEAYQRSIIVFFVWSITNWFVFDLVVKRIIKFNFNLSFPFLNTLIISIGAVLLEKYYFAKKPLEVTPIKTQAT